MKPSAILMREIFQSKRDRWVQAAMLAMTQNVQAIPEAQAPVNETDLNQMVDGFLSLLVEALEERPPETMNFYLETVIPGLVAMGGAFHGIVHTVVGWMTYVVVEVVAVLPAEHKEEATAWLSRFFAGYVAEIARIGSEAQHGKPKLS